MLTKSYLTITLIYDLLYYVFKCLTTIFRLFQKQWIRLLYESSDLL